MVQRWTGSSSFVSSCPTCPLCSPSWFFQGPLLSLEFTSFLTEHCHFFLQVCVFLHCCWLFLPSNLFYMIRHPSQLLGKILTLAVFLESGVDLRNVYSFAAVSLLCPQVKNLCNCQPCLSNASSRSVHPSILFVNTIAPCISRNFNLHSLVST